MLDVAIPDTIDAEVTLLYQSENLEDINAGKHISKITKNGFALNIIHLAPKIFDTKTVETPYYLNTLINEKPLLKKGMLSVSARTNGSPLVIANLLTTTPEGIAPGVTSEARDGFVIGVASGKKFAFTTNPGSLYNVENMETDALAVTWSSVNTFIAMSTAFRKNDILVLCPAFPQHLNFVKTV